MPGAVASFTNSRDLVPLLDQVVTVNFAADDTLWCVSIKRGFGIGGCSAEFIAPKGLFDSNRDFLQGGLVAVYVTNTFDGSMPGAPDFVGYLDVDNAQLTEEEDAYKVSASSPTAYLAKVDVGINEHRPTCEFPLSDPETGKPTRWTPARVLQDLFGNGGPSSISGGMPSGYRARIKLGNTAVLNTTENNSTPSMCFRNVKYATAVKNVLDLFGDITFVERYDNSLICYLDFLRIQDLAQPFVAATIGAFSPDPENDNVTSITWDKTSHDCCTRFIAYGDEIITVITITDDDPNLEMRLIKGWDTSLEAKVLANPERAKVGAVGYEPGMEFVFRRWYLPVALSAYTKRKNLVIQRQPISASKPGPEYPVQVYKKPNLLTANPTTGVYTAAEGPRQILKNWKDELDKGYFELATAEDGLRATGFAVPPGKTQREYTWERAPIRITLAIGHPKRVFADTLQDSVNTLGFDFGADGLMESCLRPEMQYVQFTNQGFPIRTSKGTELVFDAAMYDEDEKIWRVYTSKTVARDDTSKLEYLANEGLKEKNRPHKACTVDIPYFARAFQPGCQLVVNNDPNWELPLMIGSATWNLLENSTSVSADNTKPPPKSELEHAFKGRHGPQLN